jgi:putative nucleotidyltransferase with HDIG domain
VAMSAKVLQLVNSAFFGLGRRIGDVDEAVRYIGLGVLQALAASVGAFQSFAPVRPIDGFDIEALQNHSVVCARIAGQLLEDKADAETAFTAGLLHDVGLLVLAAQSPLELEHALRAARDTGRTLHAVETERHGSSHAELGAYVLGLWGLPHAVVEAVAHHHAPARVEPSGLDPVVAVHVADHLARELFPATSAAPPPLDEELLERLGLLDRLDEWRALAAAAVAA